jgi:predicted unusual protein kinase regulating ubiquinone biosynthesis (AarF/ABC1/UbiB family)
VTSRAQNMLLIDNFTHADLHPGNIMVKVRWRCDS